MRTEWNAARVLLLLTMVAAALAATACSDDDTGAGGASATGGRSGSGGGSSGSGEAGATSAGGGTASGSSGAAGKGTGGGSAGTGSSDAGGSAGAQTGGSGGAEFEPPPPTEGGTSVYAVECTDTNTEPCGQGATCVGITTTVDDVARVGFSCSNHCNTVADCSTAPTGAEAEPDCVQFKTAKRCMLMCNVGGVESECPSGMSCYTHEGTSFGYCLWYPE